MRILIAEDERSLNEIIAKKLTSDGYSVDCCYEDDDGRGLYEIDAHSGGIIEYDIDRD